MKPGNGNRKIGSIVHSPSAQLSGQYEAVASLAGYHFTLLYRNREQGEDAWRPRHPSGAGIDFLPPVRGRFLPRLLVSRLNGRMAPLLDAYDFDALIIHGIWDSNAFRQSIRWCQIRNRPYLIRTDANILKERGRFRIMALNRLIRPVVQGASAILYIGTRNREYYEFYGATPERLFLAPWEMDYDTLEQALSANVPNRESIRREFGFQPGDFVVCFVGRLLDLKRTDTILDAALRLCSQGIPARLLIAGDGPARPRLEKLAQSRPGALHLAGSLDRTGVVRALVASDAFVLASRREAWGLVVNEACLCGLPVLLSDQVGAAADLLIEGGNGFAFPVGDAATLAARLRYLAQNPGERSRFGRRSREIIDKWRREHPARDGFRQALESVFSKSK